MLVEHENPSKIAAVDRRHGGVDHPLEGALLGVGRQHRLRHTGDSGHEIVQHAAGVSHFLFLSIGATVSATSGSVSEGTFGSEG